MSKKMGRDWRSVRCFCGVFIGLVDWRDIQKKIDLTPRGQTEDPLMII